MILKPLEYRIFERFHHKFFKPILYTTGKRPDIEAFVKEERYHFDKKRLKTILALYVFNFWCLAYVLEGPSKAFIESKFEHYK